MLTNPATFRQSGSLDVKITGDVERQKNNSEIGIFLL